jgi:hypothetical protein
VLQVAANIWKWIWRSIPKLPQSSGQLLELNWIRGYVIHSDIRNYLSFSAAFSNNIKFLRLSD